MSVADLHKAAVFLLSLPESQAKAMLRRLPPSQAQLVAREMAKLGRPAPEDQQAILAELATAHARAKPPVEGRSQPPFAYLRDMSPDALQAILGEEHPQTIAVVLSYLPTTLAAETLAALPSDLQTSVISRISTLHDLQAEVVQELSDALERHLSGKAKAVRVDRGMSNVVKMLNAMKPAKERRLLDEIGLADPDLLHEIRCAIFGPDVAACGQWEPLAAAS